jgi:hypothetical protein
MDALRAMMGFCARRLPGVPTGSTAGDRYLGEDVDLGDFFGERFSGDFFGGDTLTCPDGEPGDSGGSSTSSTGEQMDLLR